MTCEARDRQAGLPREQVSPTRSKTAPSKHWIHFDQTKALESPTE